MKPSHGVLSFFSNEQGGVKDDLIIHNYGDKALHIVANAGCADKDVAHLKERLSMFKGDASLEILESKALIALQGLLMHALLPRAYARHTGPKAQSALAAAVVCFVSAPAVKPGEALSQD